MTKDDFRLAFAQAHHERAERLAKEREQAETSRVRRVTGKARRAAGDARLWFGYLARRSLEGPRRLLERMTSPKPSANSVGDGGDFLVVGHRGSPQKEVENTIVSCERAMRDGANALEIDLSYTKDGHVVLWHDWTPNDAVALARQLGVEPNVRFSPAAPPLWSEWRRPTHDLTLDELRTHYGFQRKFWLFFRRRVEAHIATFGEFCRWAAGQADLRCVFLDIKMPDDQVHRAAEFTDAIRQAVEESGVQAEMVFLTTRESVFEAMKQRAPEQPFSLDVEVPPGIVLESTDYSATRIAIDKKNRYASVGRPALTLGAWRIYQDIVAHDIELRREHNSGAPAEPVERLIGWTINSRAESKRLIALGVHGLLTDRPRRLNRLARRLGKRLA